MSDTTQATFKNIKVFFEPLPSEHQAEIDAYNAELSAKYAAQAAVARQEQVDIIKDAIIQALKEVDLDRLLHYSRYRLVSTR